MKKIIVFLFLSCHILIFSQNKNNLDLLVSEIQKVTQTEKQLKLVWWIPTEFWRIASQDNNLATAEQIDYLENILNDYTIFAAGDYTLELKDGASDFKVNTIKNSFSLFGLDGKQITPLKDSDINNQTLTIINNTLKPLFGQMLGKTGSGIDFFIYNNIKDGKRLINPNEPGSFKVEINKEVFLWKLPLVSLMKEKICPVDQEKMQGNWIFCPYHGAKL